MPMIGINWGSSNFRAYLIDADGRLLDEHSAPKGVAALDRDGMAAMIATVVERWPGEHPIVASGMIGSNIGWIELPYAETPAGAEALLAASAETRMGPANVRILPGIACRRSFDDAPDILRGEEIELFGLVAMGHRDGLVALPGTHTKWARLEDGRVTDFFTAMSGEIFDRLTMQGLLASIVEGDAHDGPAFRRGVAEGKARALGLGTLLFGARARVVRGLLPKPEAASYIRGLLIGAELADALAVHPSLGEATVPLIGNGPLSRLYAAALETAGVASRFVPSGDACLSGFHMLNLAQPA